MFISFICADTLGHETNTHPTLFLFIYLTNITVITSKFIHTVKYPDLPSAVRAVPDSVELPVRRPPENLNFSNDNSDSDENHGQQEGDSCRCRSDI